MTKNEELQISAAGAREQEEAKEQQPSSADVLELGADALQWIGEALSSIDIDLNF